MNEDKLREALEDLVSKLEEIGAVATLDEDNLQRASRTKFRTYLDNVAFLRQGFLPEKFGCLTVPVALNVLPLALLGGLLFEGYSPKERFLLKYAKRREDPNYELKLEINQSSQYSDGVVIGRIRNPNYSKELFSKEIQNENNPKNPEFFNVAARLVSTE